MARFIHSTSAYHRIHLPSDHRRNVLHRNHPINLSLVVTYKQDLERFDFSSRKAGQLAPFEPIPAIVFDCVDGNQRAWFYDKQELADQDRQRLDQVCIHL